MSKFMVTNPSFSEFRAGEPKAYRLAARAVETTKTSVFRKSYINQTDSGRVIGKDNKVIVYVDGIDEPFEFEMVEV